LDKKLLIPFIESLIEEKFSNIHIPKGAKGVKGAKGSPGEKGKDGNSFIFDHHKEEIFEEVNAEVKEYVDTLDLKGSDGKDGRKGKDGTSFIFDHHKEEIFEEVNTKVKEYVDTLDLKGSDGKSFSWEENKEDIHLLIEDIFENKKESFKGEKGDKGPRGFRGQKGSHGKDFILEEHKDIIFDKLQEFFNLSKEDLKLKFSNLSEEEKDELKLKFDDLTNEDRLKLKGDRGFRGQRGKSIKGEPGKQGERGSKWFTSIDNSEETFLENDFYFDKKSNDIFRYESGEWKKFTNIKGSTGVGVRGQVGLTGLKGEDGVDGKDAPRIIDIETDLINKELVFTFYFSDGTSIETDGIPLPSVQYFSSLMASIGGGSGSGDGKIMVQKDGVDVGSSDTVNFQGPNYTVVYDANTETSTITNTGGLLTVLDEGVVESTSVTKMDFVGDGVEVDNTTYISDWDNLTDNEVPNMAYSDDGYIRILINKSDAEYLVATKTCSEDIPKGRFVTATDSTHIMLAQSDVPSKAITLGISLESGITGGDIRILLFGNLESTIFSGINLNNPFFLSLNGQISSSIPSSGYIVRLGTSNGDNTGFIKIEEPIEI